MFPKINPTSTKAWPLLQDHFQEMKKVHMRELFRTDPDRFNKFSMCMKDLVFDYSKNLITEKTIELLLQLAEECGVKEAIAAMFNGEMINETERRSVLHIALRNFSEQPIYSEGNDVMSGVKEMLLKIKKFSNALHDGKYRGYSGKKIKYIVTMWGPKSLPPIPIFTMYFIFLPLYPRYLPSCNELENFFILSIISFTPGITSLPSE